MNAKRYAGALAALTLVWVSGCRSGAAADTGARGAVEGYFEAVVRQDWPSAYAVLDPEVQSRWRLEEFSQRAAKYHKGLGIQPETVRVRYCEEHAREATAQVIVRGKAARTHKTHKDAVVLRKSGDKWSVMLPADFGQSRG